MSFQPDKRPPIQDIAPKGGFATVCVCVCFVCTVAMIFIYFIFHINI
jgi:hypothetical protein